MTVDVGVVGCVVWVMVGVDVIGGGVCCLVVCVNADGVVVGEGGCAFVIVGGVICFFFF